MLSYRKKSHLLAEYKMVLFYIFFSFSHIKKKQDKKRNTFTVVKRSKNQSPTGLIRLNLRKSKKILGNDLYEV